MDIDMPQDASNKGLAWRRLAWFVGIWAAGVAALALFGWIVRSILGL